MRILIANDGWNDAGGVQTYLRAVSQGLRARGHELAFLFLDHAGSQTQAPLSGSEPVFSVNAAGVQTCLDAAAQWLPDVCYSNNMNRLDLEEALVERYPVIKFMHGYFGTCIGGQKMHGLPTPRPCERVFGPACLALYFPCHCNQWSLAAMLRMYQWAKRQQALSRRYTAMVVGSEHMREEYVRNGAEPSRVQVVPLFAWPATTAALTPSFESNRILFAGRMTTLKGGDVLIRAAATAQKKLKQPLELVMAGDGPQRAPWQRLAASLGVMTRFTGWLDESGMAQEMRGAAVLAVPSLWPEPFGLVGPEAGRFGLPAVAFGVGGIRQWLTDGHNGIVVPAQPPRARAFADGLVHFFANPAAWPAMRLAAREMAEALSVERHVAALETVLRQACRTPRPQTNAVAL